MIKKARTKAIKKHKDQKWGDHPYIKHLELVNEEMREHGVGIVKKHDTNLLSIGYLHDILEDTDTTFEELEKEFGRDIACEVDLLTKKDSDSPEEYFKKISKSSLAATVKLADRIVNLRKTNEDRSMKHYWKYLREHPYIVDMLYTGHPLEDTLTKEIEEAKRYFYLTVTANLGISKQAVFEWIIGKSNPSFKNLEKLKEMGINLL